MSAVVRRIPVPPSFLRAGSWVLPVDAQHYVRDVLRLEDGADVYLFDGEGRCARARLGHAGSVEVAEVETAPAASEPHVTLLCGLSKSDKLDFIIEKASEMGAEEVWPVLCRRSVVKLAGERAAARHERWERVALASARQCGRDRALKVGAITELPEALARVSCAEKRVLVPGERTLTATLPSTARSVALLTGPEGGLDPHEVEIALGAGFLGAGLGELVLRAETAPLVALAAVLAHAGRL